MPVRSRRKRLWFWKLWFCRHPKGLSGSPAGGRSFEKDGREYWAMKHFWRCDLCNAQYEDTEILTQDEYERQRGVML